MTKQMEVRGEQGLPASIPLTEALRNQFAGYGENRKELQSALRALDMAINAAAFASLNTLGVDDPEAYQIDFDNLAAGFVLRQGATE